MITDTPSAVRAAGSPSGLCCLIDPSAKRILAIAASAFIKVLPIQNEDRASKKHASFCAHSPKAASILHNSVAAQRLFAAG
jgi:hypothetical protein